MKMKALLYYDQRNIQLTDVDIPSPKIDEILIKVTDAGLCQTQINEFIEGPFLINKTPNKLTGKAIPLIVGHEFGGVIEKVGDLNNNSHLIGKQAAVLPLLSCHNCTYCKNSQENLCNDIAYYGILGENGGFAEYACVKKDNIFIVDNKDLLTFVEPILVAISAGNKVNAFTNIKDKKICVLGAGAIGLCVAAVFRDYFGGNVVINDLLPNRLEKAKKAGFEIIHKDSHKSDYNIVIDCAGSDHTSKSSAFNESFTYLENGGILVTLGTYFHPVPVLPSALINKEYNIITSFLYNLRDTEILSEVIRSLKIDFSYFIEKIKLENIIEDGYYRTEVDKDSFTRLVVTP